MRKFPALIAAIALSAVTVAEAKVPDTWDGLVLVKSKRLENVFLLPDADFRAYTKVMLDPAEVAFRKNWQRDVSSSGPGLSRRVSDRHAREILDEAQKRFERIFAEAFQKAGYELVTQPGEDVLRVSTALLNLDVQSPDTMSAGRSRSYSREAGHATLVIQVKDSLSGQLLGRAIDAQFAGDNGPFLRNQAMNIADFEALFERWARRSAQGLGELKANSPVDADGALRRR